MIFKDADVTDNFQDTFIGGGAAIYAYGTLIVTENPVLVRFMHGSHGGQMSPIDFPPFSPGTYPIFGTAKDYVGQLLFKNAVDSQTPAGHIQCWLYEPERAGIAPSAVINPLASGIFWFHNGVPV